VVDGVSRIECQFAWKPRGHHPQLAGRRRLHHRDPWRTQRACSLELIGGHFDGAVTTAMPVVNAIPPYVTPPIVNCGEPPFSKVPIPWALTEL
jgi:hypothetical protein